MHRYFSVAALAALLALIFSASAIASSSMTIGMDDDGLMQRNVSTTIPAAEQWQANGVRQARLTLVWTRIAPADQSTTKPAGFVGRNPDSPGYFWGDVDRAVAALESRGIAITLLVTTPMPFWASTVPSRFSGSWKPNPNEFADYVHAIATRYAGRISSYILINEPNLYHYITPQWSCASKAASSCTPASPAIYRELFARGYAEVKAADPKAAVWVGGLGPHGQPGVNPLLSSLGPMAFLRGLGCVTTRYEKDRSTPGCRGFKPVTADGISHHPHTVLMSPTEVGPVADSITIGTLPRLTTIFDRVQDRGGVLNGTTSGAARAKKRLDVFIDEYGVQTNPPDKLQGLPLSRQSLYYQQVAYMMWKNPRVKLLAFYLWRDEPYTAGNKGPWQSGEYYINNKPKPSGLSFQHPFWVDLPRRSKNAVVWGQVRPANVASVTIQIIRPGSKSFVDLRTVATNAKGFFSFTTKVTGKTSLRFRYGSPLQTSDARTVSPQR